MFKKNESGFHSFFILIIILVLTVVSFAAFRVYKDSNEEKNNVEKQVISTKTISELKEAAKTLLSNESAIHQHIPEKGMEYAYINFKPEGYKFKALINAVDNQLIYWLIDSQFDQYQKKLSDSGFSSIPESDGSQELKADHDTIDAIVAKLESLLINSSFTEIDDKNLVYTFDRKKFFMSENDICSIDYSFSIDLICAAKSDFAAEAEKVKTFVEIFESSMEQELSGTPYSVEETISENTYQLIETGTGADASSKYAIITNGNASSYFYQESGDWEYYTSSQEGIHCNSEYPSVVAKNAFTKVCNPNDYL